MKKINNKANTTLAAFVICMQIVLGGGSTILTAYAQTVDTSVSADTSAPTADASVPAADTTTDAPATTTDTTVAPTTTETSPTVDAAPVASEPVAAPTLTTDKADYFPGQTASIFGNFFQSLQNFVLKIFGGSTSDGTYVESSQNVTSDPNGSFTTTYTLDSTTRPLYTVTAYSTTDGTQLAQTTFTDPPASVNPSVSIDQCANGGTVGNPVERCATKPPLSNATYQSGNVNGQKAHWQEGEVLPYRAVIKDLAAGVNTVTFSFDTAKGSELKHAIDYLASFDTTETTSSATTGHANQNNPCEDTVPGCNPAAPSATAAITVPPDFTSSYPAACANGTFSGSALSGQFIKAWGSVSNMTLSYPDVPIVPNGVGDCAAKFKITFTVGVTHSNIVIAWGGHIAVNTATGVGGKWGAGNAVPTGSPYHMHAGFQQESPLGTFFNVGNQDLQLASSAIVPVSSVAITTTPSAGGPVGTVVHDSATLSGATSPTGSITFNLYGAGDSTCSAAPIFTSTNALSGSTATSGNFTTLAVGTYHWTASYPGDSGNSPAASTCAEETVVITKASPTISTTPSAGGAIGTTLNDTATLSGGSSPTGNVTFKLFPPSSPSCTAATEVYTDVDSAAAYATSPGFVSNAVGTWHWTADYAGDTNNNPASSGCVAEPVTVGKASPTIATTLSNLGPIAIGTAVHDSSALSGATSNAGGSVTYTVYTNSACTLGAQLAGTKTVTSGVPADSDAVTFNNAGTFYWQAVYSGDANNNGATSGCQTETLVVNPNTPSVNTTLSNLGPISIGTSVHDSAALTGATGGAGGTATYTVYSDSACSISVASGGTKTVTSGSIPNSDNVTFNNAGTFYWQVSYSGDANNTGPVKSACQGETLVVNPNSPTIATTLSAGPVDVGSTVHDSSVLSGATATAGGTVTYTAYTNNLCTLGAQAAGTKTVTNGVVPNSNSLTFNNAGDYYWQAVYSGDANNNGATSDCTSEHLVVNKVTPTLATTIHDANHGPVTSVAAGTTVHDSATISGGFSPTGNVDFTFYPNGSCTAQTGSAAGSVALSGGVAHPSSDEGPLDAGSYSFKAHYVGDANNNDATSDCEPLTVTQLTPTVVTEIHKANEDVVSGALALGTTVHDKATVGGSFGTPSGNVDFTFYPNASCSVDTGSAAGNVALASGIAHPSDSEGPLAAGSYSFKAHYNGDTNYAAANSECEPLTVNKAQLSITTTVHNAAHQDITNSSVDLGSVAHDNATVTGDVSGFPIPAVSFTLNTVGVANGTTEGIFTATTVDSAALAAGSYTYVATVGDNANYTGATSDPEPFTVNKAQLTVTTEVHDALHADKTNGNLAVGSVVHDTATVSGAVAGFTAPTPTFTLTTGYTNTCAAGDSVANNGTEGSASKSANSAALATGSYAYRASVADDGNYIGGNSSCEPFHVVNARISINPPSATNEVGHAHDYTVKVEADNGDGSGFQPVVGAIANAIVSPATSLNVAACNAGTDVNGECTVTVNSSVAGTFTITARSTVIVGGVTFKLQTNGAGENSGPATKTYVDASIALNPLTKTNNIADPHTVTVTVTKNPGTGVVPAAGEHVDFTLTDAGGAVSVLDADASTCDDAGANTDVNGQCTIVFVSATPGTVTTHATVALTVGGVLLNRATDGTHSSTGDAVKTYVAGALDITKVVDASQYPALGLSNVDGTFTFHIVGPSYPSGHDETFTVVDGVVQAPSTINLSPLIPGSYTVTEPGASTVAWVISGEGSVNVVANETASKTITNALKRPHTTISITPDTFETVPGENVVLTISDTNDGQVPLSNPSVVLTYGFTTNTLTKSSPEYFGGDTNDDGIMDVGETWTWKVSVLISVDTTFNVAGHGTDSFGTDISPANGVTTEGGSTTVKVIGTTRTLGYWQTHTAFTTAIFVTKLGSSMPIGSGVHRDTLTTSTQIFGGFYAPIAKTPTGAPRNAVDKARITLLQQLLAAKLNCAAFGCSGATQINIAAADAAYAANDKNAIMSFVSILDAFNNSGDLNAIPSGLPATGKATPKLSQSIADLLFWNTP